MPVAGTIAARGGAPGAQAKRAPARQRLPQLLQVVSAPDLGGAELRQVRRHPLQIEQRVAASAQPLDQRRQRDLGGVGLDVEHRLAEEGAPQGDAVQAPDEPAVAPAFDRVGVAVGVQRLIAFRGSRR